MIEFIITSYPLSIKAISKTACMGRQLGNHNGIAQSSHQRARFLTVLSPTTQGPDLPRIAYA
jgi:hypothetical protein